MMKIGDIGRFESLPHILNDILNDNCSVIQELGHAAAKYGGQLLSEALMPFVTTQEA